MQPLNDVRTLIWVGTVSKSGTPPMYMLNGNDSCVNAPGEKTCFNVTA